MLVADGAGRAMLLSVQTGQGRLLVHDRCGTGWASSPVSPPSQDVYPLGLATTPGGTAMALWRARAGSTTNVYSSVRPLGGTWGAPEVVVAGNTFAQFGLSDAGDAIATWTDATGSWSRARPAAGTWQAPEKIADVAMPLHLAVAGDGDAVVGSYKNTFMQAYYRPAGGPWGGVENVMNADVILTGVAEPPMDVEFTGTGKAAMLFRVIPGGIHTVWAATRTGGTWTATAVDTDNTTMGRPKLVRHPDGAIALWAQNPSTTARVAVSRYSAGWEAKKVYDDQTYFVGFDAAVNSAGQILLAAELAHGNGANQEEIYAAQVNMTDPWPALARISPLSDGTTLLFREPHVGAGGADFFVGWSVHGGPDTGQVVATNGVPACAGGPPPAPPTPTPTPTASATADPTPEPLPAQAQPTPTPTPKPLKPVKPPKAIGGFVTFAGAKRCAGSITVKLKGPRDFPVKRIVVRANGKRRATLTGAKLKKPLTLGRVPKGAFTLSFEILLKNGTTVKGKQRFPACR